MTSQVRIVLLVLQVVAIAVGIWLGNIVWQSVS
jgi:hypothetical protein